MVLLGALATLLHAATVTFTVSIVLFATRLHWLALDAAVLSVIYGLLLYNGGCFLTWHELPLFGHTLTEWAGVMLGLTESDVSIAHLERIFVGTTLAFCLLRIGAFFVTHK